MDIRAFYFQNIEESEYHYRFYDSINVENSEFRIFDLEEAITKFKELCQPEVDFTNEKKCWFYLITYYLYKMGFEIKEFPKILERPPVDPCDFTYTEIRNRIIALGEDNDGKVRYAVRRAFVAKLTFNQKSNYIEIDDSINKKFIEISNRQASFDSMSTDERLSEIANLIENLLKKDGHFITLDYSAICFEYISNDMITSYRNRMQCFRHSTIEAIEERASYSEAQKSFFVDYGLTIVKAIYSLNK